MIKLRKSIAYLMVGSSAMSGALIASCLAHHAVIPALIGMTALLMCLVAVWSADSDDWEEK